MSVAPRKGGVNRQGSLTAPFGFYAPAFDGPPEIGYGLPMPSDARPPLEKIAAYCSEQWVAADKAAGGAVPPPDHLTGEKKAYNDVFHYARTLLDEMPSEP